MLSVITHPNYVENTVDDIGFINADVVTRTVYAYTTASNQPQTLTLGASSNVILETLHDVETYFGVSNQHSLFTTTYNSNTKVRTDKRVLSVTADSSTTYITAPSSLSLQPFALDSSTVSLGNMLVSQRDIDEVQILDTGLSSFQINKKITAMGGMTVENNFTANGNIYGRNLNIWVDKPEGSVPKRIGYGLRINAQDQLEFIKYAQFNSNAEVMRKIAVFGAYNPGSNDPSDVADYLVFNNLGMFNSSGGSVSTSSDGKFIRCTESNNRSSIYFGTNYGNTSNLGLGYSNPSYKLSVNGDIFASAEITAFSDARVKDNIQTITGALDKVSAIRGCTFTRRDKDDGRVHMGVIAQELAPVVPEVISKDQDGYLSVAYGNMVALLVEAVKDLQKEMNILKERLGT